MPSSITLLRSPQDLSEGRFGKWRAQLPRGRAQAGAAATPGITPLCTPNLEHFRGERGNPSRPCTGTTQGGITPSAGRTQRDTATRRGAAWPRSWGRRSSPPSPQHPAPGNCCLFLLEPQAPSHPPCGSHQMGGFGLVWGLGFFKHFHIRDFSAFWPHSIPSGQ